MPRRQLWQRLGLAALPLATGAALLAHIELGGSLPLTLAVALLVLGSTTYLAGRRLAPALRRELRRRAGAGLLAGLLATGAYDLIRWLLLAVFRFTFQPFDIFSVFGRLLLGSQAPRPLLLAVGVLFHWANGVGFAIGYSLLFGRRGWWTGLLWALGLEAVMLAVYPGWLSIQALDEFRSISMTGHAAYGLVLGVTSRWWLRRRRDG